MRSLIFLTLLLAVNAAATEIFYYADGEHNDEILACAANAFTRIRENAACVTFTENPTEDELAFTIVHSSKCAWQVVNKTVHLAEDCITDTICTEIIGKAIGVDRPAHDVPHFVAERYNCSNGCNVRCEHGGKLNAEECTCQCTYGFTGAKCENLMRTVHFNDESCGVVEAEDQGSVALSTYPGDQQKATFCQWLIRSDDPWAKIELNFDGLDMDNEGMPAGQTCNDVLTVYGAGSNKMIPCDGTTVPKMMSTSNWVLIELRTNPFSMAPHTGPSIRYTLHTRPQEMTAYADGMTASSSMVSFATAISLVAARLL